MDYEAVGDAVANWAFSTVGGGWINLRKEEHPALPPDEVNQAWLAVGVTPTTVDDDTMGGTRERFATAAFVIGVPHKDFRMLSQACDNLVDNIGRDTNNESGWPEGVSSSEVTLESDVDDFDFETQPENWRMIAMTATLRWYRR